EIFRDQRDIGFLFFGQKVPAFDWTDTKHFEIIRRDSAAVELDRIAHAGQSESGPVFSGEASENRLAFAIMHEPRRRDRNFGEVSFLPVCKHVHDPLWFMKRQAA